MKLFFRITRYAFIAAIVVVVPLCIYFVLFVIVDGKAIVGTTKTVNKKVVGVYEGGVKDIVFSLEGDEHIYYINRGLGHGYTLDGIRNKYLGKELAISYVSQLGRQGGHINRVIFRDSVVYNELKDEVFAQ